MSNNWGNTLALASSFKKKADLMKQTDPLITNIAYRLSSRSNPYIQAVITFDPSTIIKNEIFWLSFVFKNDNNKQLLYSQKISTNNISSNKLIVDLTTQSLRGFLKPILSNMQQYSRQTYQYEEVNFITSPCMYRKNLKTRSVSNNIEERFKFRNINNILTDSSADVYFSLEYDKNTIKAFYSPERFDAKTLYNSKNNPTQYQRFKYILENIIKSQSSRYLEVRRVASDVTFNDSLSYKKIRLKMHFYMEQWMMQMNTDVEFIEENHTHRINDFWNNGIYFSNMSINCNYSLSSFETIHHESIDEDTTFINVVTSANVSRIEKRHSIQSNTVIQSPRRYGWYIDSDYQICVTTDEKKSLVPLYTSNIKLELLGNYTPYWFFSRYESYLASFKISMNRVDKGYLIQPSNLYAWGKNSSENGHNYNPVPADNILSLDENENSYLLYEYNQKEADLIYGRHNHYFPYLVNVFYDYLTIAIHCIYW